MNVLPASLLGLTLVMASLASMPALARSSDRNQPMDIDAGHSDYSLDDSRPTVLSGGVIITQGTLDIRSNVAVVHTANGEPVRAVLTGTPVKLTQELDDGKAMDAVANKVDYDLKGEVVVFTGKVTIEEPRGTLNGERVVYNMKTSQVTSGGEGAGRVKMRIQPKTPQKGGG